jgi:hypothetical protein
MLDNIEDKDVWPRLDPEDLWIYDKLIVAKKLGHLAGPAGVPVSQEGWYIVRPITNIRMMSRGANKVWLTPQTADLVPDGYFWSEIFTGDHVSVDYHYGQQDLTVIGLRDSTRLDRFSCWHKIDRVMPLPEILGHVAQKYPWINVEYIGQHAIEIHARYNDDFRNHTADYIYPVWRDDPRAQPEDSSWYDSPAGDRLGFWIINKKT